MREVPGGIKAAFARRSLAGALDVFDFVGQRIPGHRSTLEAWVNQGRELAGLMETEL